MMNMTPGYRAEGRITSKHKMRHFVEVCRDGKRERVPGEHGLMVQKMLDGVYAERGKGDGKSRSSNDKRPMTLPHYEACVTSSDLQICTVALLLLSV